MNPALRAVGDYGRMVRFTHSIFALPFALASAAFAARQTPVTAVTIAWIIVAMVAARNAAMGFNRLADAGIDARNPRTASREIPRGVLTRRRVAVFVALLAALFVFAASRLNRTCFFLSPVALAIVFLYSYTKRFTWTAQFFLGLSLAIAPIGAWIAITGTIGGPPILLGLSVLCWVAGFDIIYALQDIEFDRREGLHSIPARFGTARALLLARLLHVVTAALLLAVYFVIPVHPLYLAGVAAIAALLLYEHALVRPGDLSRINAAFFTANGVVSVVYLVTAAVAAALGR